MSSLPLRYPAPRLVRQPSPALALTCVILLRGTLLCLGAVCAGLLCMLLLAAVLLASGCTSRGRVETPTSLTTPAPTAPPVRSEPATASATPAALYEAARAADWRQLALSYNGLLAAPAAPVNSQDTRVKLALTALQGAIDRRDQETAMVEANRLMLLQDTARQQASRRFPADVVKLPYEARELEIFARMSDQPRLDVTVRSLPLTWAALRPLTATADLPTARRMDDLIAQVKQARSDDDYVRLSPQIVTQAAQVERVLTMP